MSCQEEQDMEIEALESIYPDEIEILEENPKKIQLTFSTENYEEDDDGASIQVTFKFTPNYPDELPEMDIVESENIDDEQNYMSFLEKTGEENMGMPMIYSIASALVEKLNKDNEDKKDAEEAEKDRIQAAIEEEEMKRFEGTKVTLETFLKWKFGFDKEQQELKLQNMVVVTKKPTGKKLFETNQDLFKDLADEAGTGAESVEVDEALFQDIEDLDLDDDEDDDEWNPDDETDEE